MNPWLRSHLDTFVLPRLKTKTLAPLPSGDYFRQYLTGASKEQLTGLIKCYFRAKELAKGQTLLLAGRDSWGLRVLAGMDNYPTAFRPKLNTSTAPLFKGKIILNRFGADCGYNGTAFQTIGLTEFAVTTWKFVTGVDDPHSLNPKAWADPYSLMTSIGSYWIRAERNGKEVVQKRATRAEFLLAAQRTVAIVKAVEKHPDWKALSTAVVVPKAVPESARKRVSK